MATTFSAGVWNDNPGASRFGEATRSAKSVIEKITMFSEIGIKGIEAHDNEITPEMVGEVKKVLRDNGMFVAMYTPNFFWDRKYANGALASHDEKVRKEAIEQAKKAIGTAHELEAGVLVYWNGQEGADVAFGKDGVEALRKLQDAFNEILAYDADNYPGNEIRLAIEPKPNEPRSHMLLPTVGDAIAFSYALDKRFQERVGVNPEKAHSDMVGLDYVKDIETALYHYKLFHIHLNDQQGPKYDQDLAFGSVNPKKALEVVTVLDRQGYAGPIGFDLNPLRTDSDEKRLNILKHSMENYERLLKISMELNFSEIERLRKEGDFSGLDMMIDRALLKST
jgi:xylose isomerase